MPKVIPNNSFQALALEANTPGIQDFPGPLNGPTLFKGSYSHYVQNAKCFLKCHTEKLFVTPSLFTVKVRIGAPPPAGPVKCDRNIYHRKCISNNSERSLHTRFYMVSMTNYSDLSVCRFSQCFKQLSIACYRISSHMLTMILSNYQQCL